MKIAMVHSFYRSASPSGENVVVDAQSEAMRTAGHDVRLVARESGETQPLPTLLASSVRVATGRGRSPLEALGEFAPDIVHVHNLFPNWSTRWLGQWSGPIVATLHNFRPVCAAGTLFRDGKACHLCVNGNSGHSFVHACYRNSRVATLPLAAATFGGVRASQVIQRADRLIVLSNRSRKMYSDIGVDAERMSLIPNFVSASVPPAGAKRSGWVYAGRLSDEKGIVEAVSHWPDNILLDVIGSGPSRQRIADLEKPSVRLLGDIPHELLLARLETYSGMILPSLWAEGAVPLSYMEGLAAGLDVVAMNGNAAADDILAGGPGLVVDDLAALPVAIGERERRGFVPGASRAWHLKHFAEDAWVKSMESVYSQLSQS